MAQISIIIPVYNSEKYLRKCFDSIMNQTFTDFEVIVINDGSKDHSGEICDHYAKVDSRFKVFHKTNGGVSIARNTGIEHASGEYITFIDSDDWVDEDYLQMMMSVAITDCDLVVSGIICNYTDRKFKTLKTNDAYFSSNDAHQLHSLIKSRLYYGPCNKLYKSNIIKQNKITFPQEISYGEDRIFNYHYISYVDNIQSVSYAGYHYLKLNTGSLTTTTIPNLFELEYSQWKMLNDVYRSKGAFNEEVQQDQYTDLFWIIHDNIFANRKLRNGKFYKYIKQLLTTPEICNIKKFAENINYNKIIKYSILNRNSLLLYSFIKLLNICKK